jgi:hypothetical protein
MAAMQITRICTPADRLDLDCAAAPNGGSGAP